jgi:hypothetical protein
MVRVILGRYHTVCLAVNKWKFNHPYFTVHRNMFLLWPKQEVTVWTNRLISEFLLSIVFMSVCIWSLILPMVFSMPPSKYFWAFWFSKVNLKQDKILTISNWRRSAKNHISVINQNTKNFNHTWGTGSCAWWSAYPSAFSHQTGARTKQ